MTTTDLKSQGNAAFSSGDYPAAVELFTQAIESDPNNHILYSNRSAAYASLNDFVQALEDAEKCVKLNSSWAKAYSRKGAALFGLKKFDEAKSTFEEGLKIDPTNASLKKGLEDVERAQTPPSNPFGDIFSGDIVGKVASNPQLAPLLADAAFVQKLRGLQNNPQALGESLSDPRMMSVLGALMGVNIQTGDQFAESQGLSKDNEAAMEVEEADEKTDSTKEAPVDSTPAYEEPPVEEVKDESKELAKKEKDLGTASYKKKEFEAALEHYTRAFDLDSADITILNNKGAVYLEMADFENCIKVCEEAVEKGREVRADFKHIARALGRIGTAHMKMDNLVDAIKYYQKSLSEFRSADILEKLRDAEKAKEKADREAYQNPELAEQARNNGNALFKDGKFADAVPQYTEAIKRDQKDPRAYSNRAACYTKLMALHEALKDCQAAIDLDKTFIKAYIRKAAVELLMKEYNKCMATCDDALVIDAEHHAGKFEAEIQGTKQKAYMATYGYDTDAKDSNENLSQEERLKKAMQNPKVREILSDPVMKVLLDQMVSDPAAANEHMKNPIIREKIQVLAAAGVIGMR